MTKKHFTIFLLIMAVILGAIGFGIYLAANLPAKQGSVTITAGAVATAPLSSITEYSTKSRKERIRPLDPKDIWQQLPEVDCTKGFSVNYSENTLENYSFSLYTKDGTAVYEDTPTFRNPPKPSEYIIKIAFSWGTGNHSFISEECFFKGIY